MALINCNECGREVSDKAISCPGCGAPIAVSASSIKNPTLAIAPKNRSVAAVLALFLGGLGMHKFYLNRPGWGLIYILFCWTLVPSILGFFEAVGYCFMSDESFQEHYFGTTADTKSQILDTKNLVFYKCNDCGFLVEGSEFLGMGLRCPKCNSHLIKTSHQFI